MLKRSQVQIAAFLVVAVSCSSQVKSPAEEISDSLHGSQVTAPEAEAEAMEGDNRPENDDRRGANVCGDVLWAAKFLSAIKRLLATEDIPQTTISINRFIKKPTEKSRMKLLPLFSMLNDITKVGRALRQYDAMSSLGDTRVIGLKPGTAKERMNEDTVVAPFQRMRPLTENNLTILLRETAASRRKGNRATSGREGDTKVTTTTARKPTNTPSFGDNSRKLSRPPLEDIALVLSDGIHAVHSDPIVFVPDMNVNNALTQAAIVFDNVASSDVNPFECDVTRSRRLICYVIKQCAGKFADQWHHWIIEVRDQRGEVVSRSTCIPSSPLMPGYSVFILYVNM